MRRPPPPAASSTSGKSSATWRCPIWPPCLALCGGGGFKHGQHLAFKRDDNTPLCNLFVTMLRRLGVEAETFGSSTGPLRGLESV